MTRIATWSGPRNLSTAMMYAFGAREDCDVDGVRLRQRKNQLSVS